MDLWGAFLVFFFVFIIFSCCGYCCSKKRRGAVLSDKNTSNEGVDPMDTAEVGMWGLSETIHHHNSSHPYGITTSGHNDVMIGGSGSTPSYDCSPTIDCSPSGGDSGGCDSGGGGGDSGCCDSGGGDCGGCDD